MIDLSRSSRTGRRPPDGPMLYTRRLERDFSTLIRRPRSKYGVTVRSAAALTFTAGMAGAQAGLLGAEVSPDGHNWSVAAYTTDYLQKTVPSNYSDRGRTYDYEGTNRCTGRPCEPPEDDVAEPASGYLWDLAQRAVSATLRGSQGSVSSLHWSEDGLRVSVADFSEHLGIIYDPVALRWIKNALARPGAADPAFRPACL